MKLVGKCTHLVLQPSVRLLRANDVASACYWPCHQVVNIMVRARESGEAPGLTYCNIGLSGLNLRFANLKLSPWGLRRAPCDVHFDPDQWDEGHQASVLHQDQNLS